MKKNTTTRTRTTSSNHTTLFPFQTQDVIHFVLQHQNDPNYCSCQISPKNNTLQNQTPSPPLDHPSPLLPFTIHESDILNIYLFGSRLYQTCDCSESDYDFIMIINSHYFDGSILIEGELLNDRELSIHDCNDHCSQYKFPITTSGYESMIKSITTSHYESIPITTSHHESIPITTSRHYESNHVTHSISQSYDVNVNIYHLDYFLHLLNEQYIWMIMLCYLKPPFSDRKEYIWKEEFCLTRKYYKPNQSRIPILLGKDGKMIQDHDTILLDEMTVSSSSRSNGSSSNSNNHSIPKTVSSKGSNSNSNNHSIPNSLNHTFNHSAWSIPNLEYSGLGGFNLVKFKNSTLTDISHHIAKAKRLWVHEGDYRKGAKNILHAVRFLGISRNILKLHEWKNDEIIAHYLSSSHEHVIHSTTEFLINFSFGNEEWEFILKPYQLFIKNVEHVLFMNDHHSRGSDCKIIHSMISNDLSQQVQLLIQEELNRIDNMSSSSIGSSSSSIGITLNSVSNMNHTILSIYPKMLNDLLDLFKKSTTSTTSTTTTLSHHEYRSLTYEVIEKQYKERLSEEMHDLFHFTYIHHDMNSKAMNQMSNTHSVTTTTPLNTNTTSSLKSSSLLLMTPNKLVVKKNISTSKSIRGHRSKKMVHLERSEFECSSCPYTNDDDDVHDTTTCSQHTSSSGSSDSSSGSSSGSSSSGGEHEHDHLNDFSFLMQYIEKNGVESLRRDFSMFIQHQSVYFIHNDHNHISMNTSSSTTHTSLSAPITDSSNITTTTSSITHNNNNNTISTSTTSITPSSTIYEYIYCTLDPQCSPIWVQYTSSTQVDSVKNLNTSLPIIETNPCQYCTSMVLLKTTTTPISTTMMMIDNNNHDTTATNTTTNTINHHTTPITSYQLVAVNHKPMIDLYYDDGLDNDLLVKSTDLDFEKGTLIYEKLDGLTCMVFPNRIIPHDGSNNDNYHISSSSTTSDTTTTNTDTSTTFNHTMMYSNDYLIYCPDIQKKQRFLKDNNWNLGVYKRVVDSTCHMIPRFHRDETCRNDILNDAFCSSSSLSSKLSSRIDLEIQQEQQALTRIFWKTFHEMGGTLPSQHITDSFFKCYIFELCLCVDDMSTTTTSGTITSGTITSGTITTPINNQDRKESFRDWNILKNLKFQSRMHPISNSQSWYRLYLHGCYRISLKNHDIFNSIHSTINNTTTLVHEHDIHKESQHIVHIPTPFLFNSLFMDYYWKHQQNSRIHENDTISNSSSSSSSGTISINTTSDMFTSNRSLQLTVRDFEEFLRTILRKYIHPLHSSGFIIRTKQNDHSIMKQSTSKTLGMTVTSNRMYQFIHPQLTNLKQVLNYPTNHLKTTQQHFFNMYRMNPQWCMELIERFKDHSEKSQDDHSPYLNHYSFKICQECVNGIILDTIQYFEVLCQRSLKIFRECLEGSNCNITSDDDDDSSIPVFKNSQEETSIVTAALHENYLRKLFMDYVNSKYPRMKFFLVFVLDYLMNLAEMQQGHSKPQCTYDDKLILEGIKEFFSCAHPSRVQTICQSLVKTNQK